MKLKLSWRIYGEFSASSCFKAVQNVHVFSEIYPFSINLSRCVAAPTISTAEQWIRRLMTRELQP